MPQKRLPPSFSMVQLMVAENDDAIVVVGSEIDRHIAVGGRAVIMMWIVTLLCAVICYEKYCRCKRRAVSVVKIVATQTDDEVVMPVQTMEHLRAQAREYDLATGGTKDELISRLIRRRQSGLELH